ncbi:MAG: phosphodiesterase [Firmicutes bacterium]|nr:phosphodiesterase [Bacillota bacterium]
MKLMFIADVHGSLHYTRRALEIFEEEGASYLLLLGDILYHGPRNPLPRDYDPATVALSFNSYAENIIAVKGNCDSEVDEMVLDFPLAPVFSTVLLGGRRILMTHGHIYHGDHRPPLNRGDVMLCGHTHIPALETKEGIHIANPGSLSLPAGDHYRSYGLLDPGSVCIKDLEGKIKKEISFR